MIEKFSGTFTKSNLENLGMILFSPFFCFYTILCTTIQDVIYLGIRRTFESVMKFYSFINPCNTKSPRELAELFTISWVIHESLKDFYIFII